MEYKIDAARVSRTEVVKPLLLQNRSYIQGKIFFVRSIAQNSFSKILTAFLFYMLA